MLANLPTRVFGTEITNLTKPIKPLLKPLKRSKTNSTHQNPIFMVNSYNGIPQPISQNDDAYKPNCYFLSQQVPMKDVKIEEEFDMEEETKETPQFVGVYVKEIFNYLRDNEVWNYFFCILCQLA